MRSLVIFMTLIPVLITAQDKVGINTAAPLSTLDVRGTDDETNGGTFRLSTPGETNFLRFFGGRLGDPHPFIAFTDTDTFHMVSTSGDWSTYARRMTILPDGNIGIGNELPLSKLDIKAVGDSAELLRFTTDRPWVFKQLGTGAGTKLSLQSTVDSKVFEILSENGSNRTAIFHTHNVHSNVLLVPDGGEAGVGIDDPLAKFHVKHNSSIGWPNLRITEIGEDYARLKLENDANPSMFWDIAALADSLGLVARLNFYFKGDDGSGDRMTIRGNGNVGIGTTNPDAKLDIVGGNWDLGGGSAGDLRIGNSTYNLRIGTATGGGGAGITRIFATGGANEMWLGTNGQQRMVIDGDGEIGIGTTSPGNKVRIIGDANSSVNVLSVSTGYSGSVNVRSIEGFSFPGTGYGVGGHFEGGWRGVRAYAYGNASTDHCIAVEASAYGSSGTRTGVFGRAVGGSTNWAGYFAEGNVYVTNQLRIGGAALNGVAGYKVAIDGKVIAEEMRVQLSGDWPDYVFSESYELTRLSDLENFIRENNHLPGIPEASEIAAEGFELGDMQRRMMEKIEELTLYIIEMDKTNKQLQARIEQLESIER